MSARTEAPTPRRLREARERGEVAVSREATAAGALAAGVLVLLATLPTSAARLAGSMRATLTSAAAGDDTAPTAALLRAAALLAQTLGPVMLGAAAGGLAAGLLQTRGLFAVGALRFRAGRLAPGRNLRRLVAPGSLALTLVPVARVAASVALALGVIRHLAPAVAALPRVDPAALCAATTRLLLPLAGRLALLAGAFAAADLALARARHARALRMTKDEVRREHRDDEGDPLHRAERRRRHRALLQAAPVARATCVVVNPTHLAVALHHERGSGAAPVVLAKGAGAEAARIRSDARRAGVPVVRDVALARALWRLAELGEEIPEELYEAAAAVLVHVHVHGVARTPVPEERP